MFWCDGLGSWYVLYGEFYWKEEVSMDKFGLVTTFDLVNGDIRVRLVDDSVRLCLPSVCQLVLPLQSHVSHQHVVADLQFVSPYLLIVVFCLLSCGVPGGCFR